MIFVGWLQGNVCGNKTDKHFVNVSNNSFQVFVFLLTKKLLFLVHRWLDIDSVKFTALHLISELTNGSVNCLIMNQTCPSDLFQYFLTLWTDLQTKQIREMRMCYRIRLDIDGYDLNALNARNNNCLLLIFKYKF